MKMDGLQMGGLNMGNKKDEFKKVDENEHLYMLMQKLIDEIKSNKEILKSIDDASKNHPNTEKHLSIIQENSAQLAAFNKKVLLTLGSNNSKEPIASNTNISNNYSFFGRGEKISVQALLIISSILTFLYFTTTFLVNYNSNINEIQESLRRYETFYNYHFYANHQKKEHGMQNYMDSTLKLITDKNPEFMYEYELLAKEYQNYKERYELEKKLKELGK